MGDLHLNPASLPAPNPTTSFWLSEPSDLAKHKSTTDLPQDADVIIIGSGISGCLTTYLLLKQRPDLKILILEARDFCSGATGRNGGHIKTDPYIAYETFKERFGAEKANEILKFESSHLARYERLLQDEDIECSFNITTAYDVCLTERCATIGKRAFHSRRADFPEDMKNFREIKDVEEIERLSGAKGAYWGCMYRVGSIHPYRLANGIMRRCFALSKAGGGWVNLQTQTPVESIQHQGGRWSATTANGPVSAPKLVVCCNGYVSHLLPELANKVIPARGSVSSILLPDPQPSSTPSLKLFRPLTASYSLKYQPDAFDYMICRQEDVKNLIVGGAEKVMVGKPHLWYGNTDDTQNIPGTEEYWSEFMPNQFINYPEKSSRVDRVWTGVMGFSSDSVPWVGEHPDRPSGLYVMAGFHGRGMVRVFGSAKATVDLILSGKQGEEGRKTLVESGLPRAFVLTSDRLASERNYLAESVQHQLS